MLLKFHLGLFARLLRVVELRVVDVLVGEGLERGAGLGRQLHVLGLGRGARRRGLGPRGRGLLALLGEDNIVMLAFYRINYLTSDISNFYGF